MVKYTNCKLLEHKWIRTGIRTLEAQVDEKNKNIEAWQNVTGSYKKSVYWNKVADHLLLPQVKQF